MLTPEIVVEILKSSWVICRAQPPFWIRLGARLNEAQNCGMPLTSVAGGLIGVTECAVRRSGCRRGQNATRYAGTENCASRQTRHNATSFSVPPIARRYFTMAERQFFRSNCF